MSALVYGLLTLVAGSNLHCAVRREISPCTCRQEDFGGPPLPNPPVSTDSNAPGNGDGLSSTSAFIKHTERIEVECEKMESFGQVAEALTGKFNDHQQIVLRISHSQLRDISGHRFKSLRMAISKLELNYDGLEYVSSFLFL